MDTPEIKQVIILGFCLSLNRGNDGEVHASMPFLSLEDGGEFELLIALVGPHVGQAHLFVIENARVEQEEYEDGSGTATVVYSPRVAVAECMRFDLVTGVLMRDDATLVHGENEWDGIVRMIAGVFAQAGDTLHDARSLANEMLEARAKAELHARLEEEQDAP